MKANFTLLYCRKAYSRIYYRICQHGFVIPLQLSLSAEKLVIFLLVLSAFQLRAADYYWVGGGGTWSDLNHWRLGSSGGSVPSIVPSSGDQSAAILEKMGAHVIKKIYRNMGHTINQDEINQANSLLFNNSSPLASSANSLN